LKRDFFGDYLKLFTVHTILHTYKCICSVTIVIQCTTHVVSNKGNITDATLYTDIQIEN